MPATPVYTLGHKGLTPDELIQLLQRHAIAFVIDIRQPQPSDAALAAALRTAGIRYLNLAADLATESSPPAFTAALDRLENGWRSGHALALLGGPANPAACHRSTPIGAALAERGVPVVHLRADGAPVAQADLARDAAPAAAAAPEEPAWLNEMGWDDWAQPFETADPFADEQAPRSIAQLATLRAAPGESPRGVLKRVFGYDEFRPLQQQIIAHVLEGRDALVIMPTGGGKSLCYQLPALMLGGLTVVVSPLIALMQDQVDQLRDWGIAAHYLNSTLAYDEVRALEQQVRAGQVQLLYAAPESLLRPQTLALLNSVDVALLAIDEAHCISQWGHDFRPEYRRLVELRWQLPDTVCIALTATATPRVRDDIRTTLALSDEQTFVSSFDRPNLYIAVSDKRDVTAQTRDFIRARPGQSGIVYCSTVKQVEQLSAALRSAGLDVLPYHGQMDAVTRRNNQTAFVRDDVSVIVATIAFGMGIDKPNVRWILHADLPQGMEQYYQQIGRAGRDGLRADCQLLFSYSDVFTNQFLIGRGAESERRGRELRLTAMVDWANGRQCRRRPLLAYFGEQLADDNCGMCDNCTRPTAAATVDMSREAQMFLACVYRTRQMFGMTHIIDVLRGSRSQRVLQRGHDRLSTYGIGRDITAEKWRSIADQLIDQGLLARNLEVGSLGITDEGMRVMKGEQPFMGVPVPPSTRAGSAATEAPAYDGELFEKLRILRKQLADARGVPPYVIFADRTLQEMAAYFPQSESALLTMHGVGSAKLQQYANDFLPVIRDYCRANGLQEQLPAAAPPPKSGEPAGVSGRAQTIGEAVVNGWAIDALAAELGLKPRTVVGHLEDYVRAGGALPEGALFALLTMPPATQVAVLEAYAAIGDQFLRPVFDHFEGSVDYDDLRLVRIIYWLRQRG